MKYAIATSLLFFFLLGGCIPHPENIEVLSAQPSEYELHLYTESDEQSREDANNYLSALVDWKASQHNEKPLNFKQAKTNENNKDVSDKELPTLVIKKNGKVLSSISGNSSQKEILDEINKTIPSEDG